MTAPAHASYSQLNTWLRCGEQYRLERVEGVDSRPGWYLVGGTAFHEVTEKYDRNPSDDFDVTAEWCAMFDATLEKEAQNTSFPTIEWRAAGRVSKEKPNKEDHDWWRENGAAMVQQYIDWRNTTKHWSIWEAPDGSPGIELVFTVILGGLPVKGAIDRLFVTDAGELVVVDLKTGMAPDSDQQLGLYAVAVEELFGIRPSHGAYYLGKKGALTAPAPLDHYTKKYFDFSYSKFQIARDNGIYLPKVSSMCISCGVSRACAAYGGPEANLYTPEGL